MKRAIALLVCLCAPLAAQVTGRITGSVTDPAAAAVPGASVNLMLPGGSTSVVKTVTTSEGLFNLTGIRPDFYDLLVESRGFRKVTVRGLKVDPGRETVVAPMRLEIEAVAEVVEVSAGIESVQTSNAEVSGTVTSDQLRRLPLTDRVLMVLLQTQAGVSQGRGAAVINGLRTSYSSVTLDGVSIQDNFLRSNGLNFLPNMLQLDQVAEVTVSTSNANSTVGGGASQVIFVTPSGTNTYHGLAYWYNRNSAVAANDWFSNRDRIGRDRVNLNTAGASLGGPILRDKVLFYGNYEAIRPSQSASVNRTILTEEARRGIFTYEDPQGAVRKVNILQAAGAQPDPATQALIAATSGPDKINNFRLGDSREGLLRNTAGYSFLARNNRVRDHVTGKLDYFLSTRNAFTGTFVWNRDQIDRNDTNVANDFSPVPKVKNDDSAKLVSAAWRWNPAPTFTNELRGGFNLAPITFRGSEQFGDFILAPPANFISNPVNTFRDQGRNTNTYTLLDNAGWVRGRHSFQFGFQTQQIRVENFNEDGINPTYTLGIGTGNSGLTTAQLPGVGASDLIQANNLLATLAGYVTSYSQRFNITSRTSGFVDRAPLLRHYSLNNYAFYAQDAWKAAPRLTLTLGLRYELFSVVDERDSLVLMPVLGSNNHLQAILSNSTLDFAGSAAGRPWYGRDKDDFAPNVGLAWDLFGNGKTALRAGYSIARVNDDTLVAADTYAETNTGLSSVSSRPGLTGRVSSGRPAVALPVYKVPRTFEDNYRLNPSGTFGIIDPGLRTPYVQMWTFGIQHEVKRMIVEARYVGNHATKALRALDYNQVLIGSQGFLEDFQRALSNGNLARAATGVFNPNFNANIAGSRPLTVFPRLASGGLLDNATVRGLIETGQVGELATTYQTGGLNGAVNFFPNPFALTAAVLTNYSNSTYNALQIDMRRRTAAGVQFQANYTFSKVLSDTLGTGTNRFEPFLDQNNARVERARPNFDITHGIKANTVYELPFGDGRRWNYRPLGRLLSGWATSGFLVWQSGGPFSILSGRGTLNRSARSGSNTAHTSLNKSQLDELLQVRQTGSGPYFVGVSAIGSDGRAVAPDGRAFFNGQSFFQPGPGDIGSLQRRMFSGPWTFNLDLALMKTTRITERHSIELRAEASNLFNNPTWQVLDQTISSVNFGRISNTFYGARSVQFALQYRF